MMERKISIFMLLTVLLAGFELPVHAQSAGTEVGIASYYHNKFVGRKTASGEIFVQDRLTAAHKTLPLGTWVRVTNLSNDSVVIVKINDRMPKWNKRSIDLTYLAATKLGYIYQGLAKVRIEVVPAPEEAAPRPDDLPVDALAFVKYDRLPGTHRQMDPASMRDLTAEELILCAPPVYSGKKKKK
ncbi:MAG: septal ring lytic transglycosylase RlpA family protein [Chitinophagales bacterium]